MSINIINPQELARLYKDGTNLDLIDVRIPVEYREVHLEFARSVPLEQLDVAALMQHRNESNNEPLYVICRSGSRGQQACDRFLAAGFSNVINVEGGTLACVQAGVGQRGYLATRILQQKGFSASNIGGGYKTFLLIGKKRCLVSKGKGPPFADFSRWTQGFLTEINNLLFCSDPCMRSERIFGINRSRASVDWLARHEALRHRVASEVFCPTLTAYRRMLCEVPPKHT